ncbi:MAG: hypothetical protein AAB263_16715 [Planctomycetota bacterium]
MLRPIMFISIILLTGCVSESDVRAQVDQSATTIRHEFATSQNAAAVRNAKLVADIERSSGVLRDFLQHQRASLVEQIRILDQIMSRFDNASFVVPQPTLTHP